MSLIPLVALVVKTGYHDQAVISSSVAASHHVIKGTPRLVPAVDLHFTQNL
ncbi:MAG: hypothetical protein IPP42_01065 [Saprospiraceae bacterium]|nr:hypothetical protein [Saprospiraceae bacterium]